MSEWYEELSQRGFAVLEDRPAPEAVRRLGRSSEPRLLTATDRTAAAPWSLSGVYGRGLFPWHTDGAVASQPPRWLMLRAVRITEQTSTELLEPSVELHAAMRRTTLRITDRVGNVRYRMAALPVHGSCRVRWDPRIAVPQGGLSIEDVDREPATAQVDWSENRILILDNSRLLHRRPAVRGSGERILERTYLWDD